MGNEFPKKGLERAPKRSVQDHEDVIVFYRQTLPAGDGVGENKLKPAVDPVGGAFPAS
jgi:hypothetical protein